MSDSAKSRTKTRSRRRKFAAMLSTYALGTFNDSLFRVSAMLIAVAVGMKEIQGYVMSVFTLPYLLCAAYTGWLADKYRKRMVIVSAKVLELLVMLAGGYGIVTGNWAVLYPMIFLMGLQSAIFSPSLNGTIPEQFPASYVTTAKAFITVAVTASILIGGGISGVLLREKSLLWGRVEVGRLVVALALIAMSVVGIVTSLGIPGRRAADPKRRFPWRGPVQTLIHLWEIRRDRLLTVAILAGTYAWFVGALLMAIVNAFADRAYYGDEGYASAMLAAELIGLAGGGVVASRIVKGKRWHRPLAPAAGAMAVLMFAASATVLLPRTLQFPALLVLLSATGFAGGVLLIPCEAFYQIRPDAANKGTIIAAANSATFLGVLLSGPIVGLLLSLLSPTQCFLVVGCLSVPVSVWLAWALPRAEAAEPAPEPPAPDVHPDPDLDAPEA